MTTPNDNGPFVPRRPLGKSGTPDGGSSESGGSRAPVQTVEPGSESSAAADTATSSESGRPSNGASGKSNGVGGPATGDARRDADPAETQAMGKPLYAPGPSRYGASESDTESAPVIPPPAAAPVDKRAERAAAKQQRKLEASKPRTVRRAKLRVVRLDPWSVTKAAFLLSIAFGIMCVVAVFLVFSIMSASGLWDSVNTTIQGVVNQRPDEAFDIKDYVGMSRVMGITMLIAAIDVVIITALATLGAFIYNMAASLLGGVEVTLAEDLR